MRQNEDWPDFLRAVKQGLEPDGGQHMCHWRGQRDGSYTGLVNQETDGLFPSTERARDVD